MMDNHWSVEHQREYIREQTKKLTLSFMEKEGRPMIEKNKVSFQMAMQQFNLIFGDTTRLNLQTIGAMILAADTVAEALGHHILHDQKFIRIHNLFHAVRILLIEERDQKLGQAGTGLSPASLDNTPKQS